MRGGVKTYVFHPPGHVQGTGNWFAPRPEGVERAVGTRCQIWFLCFWENTPRLIEHVFHHFQRWFRNVLDQFLTFWNTVFRWWVIESQSGRGSSRPVPRWQGTSYILPVMVGYLPTRILWDSDAVPSICWSVFEHKIAFSENLQNVPKWYWGSQLLIERPPDPMQSCRVSSQCDNFYFVR